MVDIRRNSGERNDKRFDVDCCIVLEVKDGRIVAVRKHFFDLHAWDEFSS